MKKLLIICALVCGSAYTQVDADLDRQFPINKQTPIPSVDDPRFTPTPLVTDISMKSKFNAFPYSYTDSQDKVDYTRNMNRFINKQQDIIMSPNLTAQPVRETEKPLEPRDRLQLYDNNENPNLTVTH